MYIDPSVESELEDINENVNYAQCDKKIIMKYLVLYMEV